MLGRTKKWMGLGVGAGLAVAIAVGLLLTVPLNAAGSTFMANAQSVSVSSCATGTYPEYVTYDPVNRYFYVDNVEGGSISVFKGTCTLVTTIALPTGASPRGNAYDASNNYIYVADETLNQLYVISGTKVIQTIASESNGGEQSLAAPWGVAYDPAGGFYDGSGYIVVSNSQGSSVSFFATPAPSTGATLYTETLPVGSCPSNIAYVPFFSELLVANTCSDNVTAIGATVLNYLDPGIPVGKAPQGIIWDPATEEIYVGNTGGKNLTVISDLSVVRSIKVGTEPIAVAFDQSNLHLYVANQISGTLSVIGITDKVTSTITLPAGADPVDVAWDGANGHMVVTSFDTSTVYSLS